MTAAFEMRKKERKKRLAEAQTPRQQSVNVDVKFRSINSEFYSFRWLDQGVDGDVREDFITGKFPIVSSTRLMREVIQHDTFVSVA